jgi:5'-AMP-activated protein kinase regulatory beta subunit
MLQDYVPESLDGLAEFETPSSPESSYDNYLPSAEDYSKDPPLLPSQLHLNSELESLHAAGASISASPRPDHVILNHLFLETRKQVRSPVLTLGFTHRFRSKYSPVILHKPLRR